MSFYGTVFYRVGILPTMLITNVPTAELRRLIRSSERSPDPDQYALAVLRRELERRRTDSKPDGKQDREATPCG